MTLDMLGPYAVAFGVIVIGALRVLLGRMITQMDHKVDKLFDLVAETRKEVTESRLDVSKNYVTKTECQSLRTDLRR